MVYDEYFLLYFTTSYLWFQDKMQMKSSADVQNARTLFRLIQLLLKIVFLYSPRGFH